MSLATVSHEPHGVASTPAAHSHPHRWQAETLAYRRYDDIASLLEGLEGSTFQSRFWLENWLECFGQDAAIEPILVVFRDGNSQVTMALPLISRVDAGLRVIEFSDLSVTDYASPLMRRDALASAPGPADLWLALRAALPEADILRFNRLCPKVAGMDNPFYSHGWTRQNRLSGWVLPLKDSWLDSRERVSASQRDKLDKLLRRFERVPGSEMIAINDAATARAALTELSALQAARLDEKGQAFHLQEAKFDTFYRRFVTEGIEDGRTMMCGLRVNGEWIALNFGIRAGDEIVYLRLGCQFGDWARLSPGVVVTEMMVREAHRRGVRNFDFAMGNYEYKRRLGAKEMPLRDLVLPMSARGFLPVMAWHIRHRLAHSPWLRRLMGRGEVGRIEGASA